jgi:hypothetical protein
MPVREDDAEQGSSKAVANAQKAQEAMYKPSVEVIRYSLTPASTIKNQLETPLLRLPPEIHNRIYEYACGGVTICPTAVESSPYRLWSRRQRDSVASDREPLPSPHNYLLVCR